MIVLLAALAACSVLLGAEWLPPARLWSEWQSGRPLHETPALSIVWNQRLPRTLAALIAGAGLSIAGAAFQGLLRNPLAEPYTLGVAGAAALGAWLSFLLADAGWIGASLLGLPSSQAFAFAFAGGNMLLVYGLAAGTRARTSAPVLLLAGVTLGMLFNAGILLTRYIARPDRLVMMDRWMMGGVDVIGFGPALAMLAGVLPCAAVLGWQARALDQYAFNEDLAAGRGVHVSRLQFTIFLAGSLLVAVVVSEAGPIGFVGLLVPHVVRMLIGPAHGPLMALSLAAGGAFLVACDLFARSVFPGEVPIGIVTTLIGGPYFLYQLLRRRFDAWGA